MKHGEEGSETRELLRDVGNGGCMDNPFIFLGFLGPGDVIGRSKLLFVLRSICRPFRVAGSSPKVLEGNEFKGIKFTGESGDDEGEGSESDEVSVVRVGEESADSEVWVDVLS